MDGILDVMILVTVEIKAGRDLDVREIGSMEISDTITETMGTVDVATMVVL